ncbi:MAG: hypothetical protein IPP72_14590 [Chitinophagaceae bacterium]|nr:hypothetical protein [Chitinophagaceae bacterium]
MALLKKTTSIVSGSNRTLQRYWTMRQNKVHVLLTMVMGATVTYLIIGALVALVGSGLLSQQRLTSVIAALLNKKYCKEWLYFLLLKA